MPDSPSDFDLLKEKLLSGETSGAERRDLRSRDRSEALRAWNPQSGLSGEESAVPIAGANEPKKEKGIPSHLILTDHFKVTIVVVLISLSSLAIFGYGGYTLDQYFGTKYIFMVALLLISFPSAQYVTYRWITRTYLDSIKKKYQ